MHQQEQPDHDVTFGLPVVMAELLDTLRLNERKVLYLRFYCDATLNQIWDMFDLSQERIRQIELSALRKMKHPSRSDLLKDFY
jgi:RNA polymerase primary sigma factor